jgi:hypothetical protein
MRTPTTESGLRVYDHLRPEEAVRRAWNTPGPNPYWHTKMQARVRKAMPLLARALDRLNQ